MRPSPSSTANPWTADQATSSACWRRAGGRARPRWRRSLAADELLLGRPVAARTGTIVLGQRHPRARNLDPLLRERGEQLLAELAGGSPLVGGPDRAQDLQRDADGRVDRFDAVDPWRIEDPPLPLRISGHRL